MEKVCRTDGRRWATEKLAGRYYHEMLVSIAYWCRMCCTKSGLNAPTVENCGLRYVVPGGTGWGGACGIAVRFGLSSHVSQKKG